MSSAQCSVNTSRASTVREQREPFRRLSRAARALRRDKLQLKHGAA